MNDTETTAVKIRNFEPWNIEKVVVDEDDPEEIKQYKRKGNGTIVFTPENTVQHIIDSIGNDGRGIPMFNSILRPLHYVYKLTENLHWIYHVRARIPAVRKVRGGATKIEAEKNRYDKLPAPGHVPVENDGVEWKFPDIKGPVGAKEAWGIFMQEIAAAFCLPVFLVTSDFSNHALASTLAADSPTIRLIQDYREKFEGQFKVIVGKAMGGPCDVTFEWPPIVEHDPKELSMKMEIDVKNGFCSKETASKRLGYDWEGVEAQNIADETDRAMKNFLRQKGNVAGTEDEEEEED